MEHHFSDKRKLFSDPVSGIITIPSDLIFQLIEHPYFQRLRRIRQLGLSHLVYPGALHTRFAHSIGAMDLMNQAFESLRSKGHEISREDESGALAAILLHDIGHGPFSHALENSIIEGLDHEEISLLLMQKLNSELKGALSAAIDIFSGTHSKRWLHQLVSSQLDMDRLDYLRRDSFYCGVAEGIVNTDRIIKTLNITGGELCIDVKGIYSAEKFIIARRLMYWQVYLHKTVISAESLLIRILRRAKWLSHQGRELFGTPALLYFLRHKVSLEEFRNDLKVVGHFNMLDDFDVFSAIKVWCDHDDHILSYLCQSLVRRELFRIEMQHAPFEPGKIDQLKKAVKATYHLADDELDYFVFTDSTSNYAYDLHSASINILLKNGQVLDFTEASEEFNVTVLTGPVTRFILGYPKKMEADENRGRVYAPVG